MLQYKYTTKKNAVNAIYNGRVRKFCWKTNRTIENNDIIGAGRPGFRGKAITA